MSLLYYNFLNTFEGLSFASIVLRYIVCIIFGGVIGIERGKKNHPAGLRTHLMVCLGSASVMMVSQYIFLNLSSTADPARLGAQVISGIGFLGVGTIVVTSQNQVKGLTTAAGLWASACMGLSIGIGFFEGALILCLFMYLVLEILHRLDQRYLKVTITKTIYIEYRKNSSLSSIFNDLYMLGWKIINIKQIINCSDIFISVMVTVVYQGDETKEQDILSELMTSPEVLFACNTL